MLAPAECPVLLYMKHPLRHESHAREQASAFVEYAKRKLKNSGAGGDQERKHRCFGVAQSRCYRLTVAELFCVTQTLPEPLQFQQKNPYELPPVEAVLMVNKCTFSLPFFFFSGSSSVSVNYSKSSHCCLSDPFTPQTAKSQTH